MCVELSWLEELLRKRGSGRKELTKQEKSNRRTKNRKQCGPQPPLLSPQPVLQDVRDEEPVQVGKVDCHCDDAADYDAGEYDTGLADVEAVEWAVDQGEDFEEGVVYSVG